MTDIATCDAGHAFLSSAQPRCPWCEIERLRAECLRLNHAEAEAMSVVLSQEGQIEKLRAERDAARDALGDKYHGIAREHSGWCRHEGIGYDYCLACRSEKAEAERDALQKDAERRMRLLRDVKENLDVAKANSGAYAFDKFAGHLPTCVSPRGDQVCQCGYSSVRFNIEALLEECNSDVEGATMNSVAADIDSALAAKEKNG